jgi:hypothetical protein
MEDLKHIGDGVSALTALGALVGMLPAIAAALSILWTVLRIYESKTVQGWIKKGKK